MTTRTARLVVLCGFLMAGVGLQAHHSVAGVYDLHKEVILVGALKKLNFTNPHSSIELTVTNKDGSNRVESDGAAFFGAPSSEGAISDPQCYFDAVHGRFVALAFTQGNAIFGGFRS